MNESKKKLDGSGQCTDKQIISRRLFLKEVSLASLTAISGSALLQACTPTPPQPKTALPAVPGPVNKQAAAAPMTVMEALKNRKSTNAFQLSHYRKKHFWSCVGSLGINRPDSGKRTAPSAVNAQEIDIYVLLAEGAFVYDAKANQLMPVVSQDLRPKSSMQGFMKDAPVHLIFVADNAKYRNIPQAQRELFSSSHTGFIGQNVYLYCAAYGLGAHFYASVDRSGLKTSLKLRDDQSVIFGRQLDIQKSKVRRAEVSRIYSYCLLSPDRIED